MSKNIKSNISNVRLPDNMEGKEIFKPEFIPIYTQVRDDYELSRLQAEVYGFIRMIKERMKWKYFNFTNKQLAFIHNCSEVSINKTINELVSKNLIKKYNEVRPNGGITRHIYLIPTDKKLSVSNDKKLSPNNNINNNIYNKEILSESELFDLLDGKSEDKLPPLPF